jgi:hypothetical protein
MQAPSGNPLKFSLGTMQMFVECRRIITKLNVRRWVQIKNIRDGPRCQHWLLRGY